MPDWIADVLEVVAKLVDGVGFVILAFTASKFVIRYVAFEIERVRGSDCVRRFRDIRLELGSHIILAIDFMVIADVIRSALEQTLDSLIILGGFVLVRSILAFFLGREMNDIRAQQVAGE